MVKLPALLLRLSVPLIAGYLLVAPVTGLVIEPSPDGIELFEKKVRPVLIDRCYDCHSGDEPESGLAIDSLAGLIAGGLRGPAVVVGKPEESLLVRVLRHGEQLKMPPKEKLATSSIADIATWIELGAPWPNAQPVTISAGKHAGKEPAFTDEQLSFWAFQRPARPATPQVGQPDWIASPIDAFVLQQLESAGLSPVAPATRRSLIRRATLDLHGLPPTPAEVEAFVADESPDAYERLVDRLLASPRYGERWGRHWLDVARYADSNGLDENLAYANAFRYRDYVIAAFNKDKPFNQFVLEQIAGDLFNETPFPDWDAPYEGDIATGFLALGAKMLAEDDPVKMQMDIIDEQVDTLGRAFLGMTFGCARCHDHKFDPIPTADYYSLAGIFKSTKTMENFSVVARWQEKPLMTAESRAALDAHDDKISEVQNAIDRAVADARQTVVDEARQHVGDYLLAAMELRRRETLLANATIHGEDLDLGKTPHAILIEAEEFDRGNVLRDRTNYGRDIGVIVSAGKTPNFAEYDIEVSKAGLYQLETRLAAFDSRPTVLHIDGQIAKQDLADAVTGSWFPDTQKWFVAGFFYLPAGKSVIRLEQPNHFPHIDKLLFVPAPPDAEPTSPTQAVAALGRDPGAGVVIVEAETVARGNLVALADGYGKGIGVIAGPGGANEGEIDINVPSDGHYKIAARYAAQDSRPTQFLINGKLIKPNAFGEVTGTWYPDTQRWFIEGSVQLRAGTHVVRLQRAGPIPHIDKIMLVESSRIEHRSPTFAPLGDYQPLTEFVQQLAKHLHAHEHNADSPIADLYAALDDDQDVRAIAAELNAPARGGGDQDSLPAAALLDDLDGTFKPQESLEDYFQAEHRDRIAGLRAEKKRLEESRPTHPEAMAISDGTAENLRIHIRGSHLTQGREVPRQIPRVFTTDRSTAIGNDRSGRLELARWIADPSHPLTARVIVNRVWLWHFGEGIVRSPDNFGRLGLRPTHPELLDWLAVEFVESGWSLKTLHRQIMLSSTYRMGTAFNERAMAMDPDNKLWWRFNRRRLEAESIRDSILAVTGQLDLGMGGSILPTKNRQYVTSTANVDPVAYQTDRRSVYMPVVRSALYDVFQAFDFAEPSVPSGKRQSTTVAPQALFMMNSKIVSDATRAMANHLLELENSKDANRVRAAYRAAYGRSPTEKESRRAEAFVESYTESLADLGIDPQEARIRAWQGLCRVILSANEFIFVE